MSELVELYLIFLVIYLFECLAWVPHRTVGFYRFAGRWRGRIAFRPASGRSCAVVFGKPWPPLSPPWLAEPLPLAMDPRGITLIESDHLHLRWEALAPVVACGNRVESGELLLSTLASCQGAASLAAVLEKTRKLPAQKREAELRKFLDARFDLDAPLSRRRTFRKSVRLLLVCSNAFWMTLFGGLGVAVFANNTPILLAAAALSFLLWPLNAIAFWLTLRNLTWLPREYWPDRSKRLVAILSPLSGVRGADLLAREIWANLDPLTVAAALFSPSDFLVFARPLVVAMQTRKDDPLSWWRGEIHQRMERVLEQKKVDLAALLRPPAREGPHVGTYCPCCLAQYEPNRKVGTLCPNEVCPSIPLRGFAENEKAR